LSGWKQLKNINAIKCNQYIERRMGISWTDGNLDYNELENVLFELEKKKTIYVKGREKVKFLEQYFCIRHKYYKFGASL